MVLEYNKAQIFAAICQLFLRVLDLACTNGPTVSEVTSKNLAQGQGLRD